MYFCSDKTSDVANMQSSSPLIQYDPICSNAFKKKKNHLMCTNTTTNEAHIVTNVDSNKKTAEYFEKINNQGS